MVTGITACKKGPLQMDYNTIFVGMDVHEENISLFCYSIEQVKQDIAYVMRKTIVLCRGRSSWRKK